MSVADGIALGITIGLGVVSIILSIFAIWLSHRFSQQSGTSLSMVQDLVSEIRILTKFGLSQQECFTSKMLDSILSQGPYQPGLPVTQNNSSDQLSSLIKKRLEETEKRISQSVEKQVRALAKARTGDTGQFEKAIEAIRADIASLRETASSVTAEVSLPSELLEKISKWKRAPGLPVLLSLIINETARSSKNVEDNAKTYNLPNGWEAGIDQLLKAGILEGDAKSFKIAPKYEVSLASLIARNTPVIQRLIAVFALPDDEKHKELMYSIVESMQF